MIPPSASLHQFNPGYWALLLDLAIPASDPGDHLRHAVSHIAFPTLRDQSATPRRLCHFSSIQTMLTTIIPSSPCRQVILFLVMNLRVVSQPCYPRIAPWDEPRSQFEPNEGNSQENMCARTSSRSVFSDRGSRCVERSPSGAEDHPIGFTDRHVDRGTVRSPCPPAFDAHLDYALSAHLRTLA